MDIDSIPIKLVDTLSETFNETRRDLLEMGEHFEAGLNTNPLLFACLGSGLFFLLVVIWCLRCTFKRRRNIKEALHIITYNPSEPYRYTTEIYDNASAYGTILDQRSSSTPHRISMEQCLDTPIPVIRPEENLVEVRPDVTIQRLIPPPPPTPTQPV